MRTAGNPNRVGTFLPLCGRARRPPDCRRDGGATFLCSATSALSRLLLCFLLQGGVDLVHLRFGVINRAGVVDYEVCALDLQRIRKLRGHATYDFAAGGFDVDLEAMGIALYALFFGAGHDDQAVESIGGACFEDQRGFDYGDPARIAAAFGLHPIIFVANDGRVDDGVQFADSGASGWIRAEGGLGELRAIDAAVGVQDGAAEVAYDFFVHWLARLHKFVGNVVGLDEVHTARHEHLANNGFAAGDPAG